MDGGLKQRDKDKDRNNQSVSTSKNGARGKQKQKQKQLARALAQVRARAQEYRSIYAPVTVIINRYLPTITSNSCQSCDHSLLLSYRYTS